jgi:hypothetical protein
MAPRDYSPLAAWTTKAANIAYSKAATNATQMAKATANAHYKKEIACLLAEANSYIQQDLAAQKAKVSI